MRLDQRSWPEVERSEARTLLIPLGSTEQHGPHLPLSTDSIIAEAWCDAIAAAVPGRFLVAPVQPYGAAGEHQDFAGTLSIGTEVLQRVLMELIRSAGSQVDEVVLVSGHAGNAEALARTRDQARYEGHSVEVLLPVLDDGDAHAGRTETSLMLFLRPDLVRLDRAEPGRQEPITDLLDQLREQGVRAVAPNGVLGDPGGASAAEGEQLLGRLAELAWRRLGVVEPPADPTG